MARIIVIEDQEDLAALYEAALQKAGYEVVKAYTGEEGVAEFEDRGADAVLLDMTLPEMHGTETLQRIRALDARVPVVVATGESSAETRAQSERLGVHRYLSKPVDYDELAHVFRRALSDPATTTEEYEVVTLRLPRRVVKILNEVDPNLERAVTTLCEERLRR
ncbi:MAG TPA: response regulator [Pyrinomonadaceae bacterium]|nr:response regulator [Pyrinomonadaceae bacterium]